MTRMLIFVGVLFSATLFLSASEEPQRLEEQKIQSYATCKTDDDCKPNSFCFGNDDNKTGKCKCVEGYELIRNTTYYECLKGVKLGEACKLNVECHVTATKMSECKNEICTCNQYSHGYADGQCYITIKLNDICTSDYNCYLSDGNYGYCLNGRCACPNHQRPSLNRTYCISNKRMGEICLSDEECGLISNAQCQEVCRCASGYILARSGRECIKAATSFGENCTLDAQCSAYLSQSICLSGSCGCIGGFHGYGNRCVRTRKRGERCEEDAQCIYEPKLNKNVECRKGNCTCSFGVTSTGDCKIEKTMIGGGTGSSAALTATMGLILLTFFAHTILF